jgi:hypothetical protein
MAEENPQPESTGDQPAQAPHQQTGQKPMTPPGQSSGQRRNDRRDHSRHYGGRGDHRRDQQQSPRPAGGEKPLDTTGKEPDIDDEEETEQDRSSPQGRHHHRGGRPPKKVIEEWANDPYCE